MTMTRAEREEWLRNATNEEVIKQLRVAVSFMMNGKTEYTQELGAENYELAEAEILRRMQR